MHGVSVVPKHTERPMGDFTQGGDSLYGFIAIHDAGGVGVFGHAPKAPNGWEIGRASCREHVTGVQTCALPIWCRGARRLRQYCLARVRFRLGHARRKRCPKTHGTSHGRFYPGRRFALRFHRYTRRRWGWSIWARTKGPEWMGPV